MLKVNKLTSKEIMMVNETIKNDLLPYYIVKYPSS